MKSNFLVLVIFVLMFINVFSQDKNFHIYLCFGQSNMEGSAKIEKEDQIASNRFLALQSLDCDNLLRKKNSWYPALPPLTQCYTGLSPADYFGKTMIKHLPDSVKVGVINVAIGGSDIRLFDKDIYQNYTQTYPEDWFQKKIRDYSGNPYQHFIELAKLAKTKGVIKGILLHQGETNQDDKNWPEYVKVIYNSMLSDLNLKADEVPLLAGELVHEDQNGVCASMNPIINRLPNVIETAYVVSSKGCEVSKDNVHFNSKGVRELGKRYALKMLSLKGYEIEKANTKPPFNLQVSNISDDSFKLTWDNIENNIGTNVFIEDPTKNTGNVYLKTLSSDKNSYTYKGKQSGEVTINSNDVFVARLQTLPDVNDNAYATAIVNMADSEGISSSTKFDPDFHIYLCIGQSNMEGSAAIEPQDLTGNSRFQVLQSLDCGNLGKNENRWYTAIPPLFHCNTGLSPADYFGRTMVDNLPKKIKVGVVPVAVGGCDIRLFDKDIYQDFNKMHKQFWFTDKIVSYRGNPYSHLINLAKMAQKRGVIKGILLHQGEANQDDENWPKYVKKVYENILEDLSLSANAVPLLSGEVVNEDYNGMCASMNPIINTLPTVIPTAHVISSKGCDVKEDNLHFNSAGVRELGKRYALKMLNLQKSEITKKSKPKNKASVEVLSNNNVAFRIYAPEAKKVTLRSDDKWDKINFEKDDEGVWKGTWNNVESGAYRYRFIVDGVEVFDPKSETTRENVAVLKVSSGDEFFAIKNHGPHGAISKQYYYSKVLNQTRRMHIWTPPGFENSKKKLPVLYLIHGGGDNDTAWSTIGCAGAILDNLLAEGKIEPMLVVMPNGTIETDNILDRVPLFKEDFITQIIPFIESNYKVYRDNEHRAIMGLSMGGLETLEAVTYHPDAFGYVGVLSSGWWITESWKKKRGISDNKEERAKQLHKIAKGFNESVKLLYFMQGGEEDIAYKNGMATQKLFDEAGINYKYSESPGGHTWKVWRKNLYEITPLLFK